jgi:hypothetical protein
MANNPNTPLFGYPCATAGGKIKQLFDHSGPASYGNIGTSSGTGDVINASDLSMGGFDMVNDVAFGYYTFSGTYFVKVFTSSSGTTPAVSPATGSAFSKFILQWFTTSAPFGAVSTEVTNATNLSAETVRIELVGE